MPQAALQFPAGFLWGTATAAHQVEGNNTNNNWWAWEQEPGRIIHGHKSGLACDWWGGRWREDFDRAAETGQNTHRLSVEWSRIQPAPDRWDEDAIDYYRQIVRGLVDRGMTPMVTLHHFTDPLWLAERGGWEDEAAPALFAAFTRKVVEALKEYVTVWVTINEPNVYSYSAYVDGVFPPGKRDMGAAFRVMANMVRGHAAAYSAIHSIQKEARVGIALHYRGMIPARTWFPGDRWLAGIQSAIFNDLFPHAITTGVVNYVYKRLRIPEAAKTQDFLGINYYCRDIVALDLTAPRQAFSRRGYAKDADLSDHDYIANDPEGMFEAIRWGTQFRVPILITENGVENVDDEMRQRYLAQHLQQVWRAINFNWPVKGYYHWSLVDNFEWERGWTMRFGLWELDVETQARRKRPSVDFYEEICKQNCLTSEMVGRYAPEVMGRMFPG